MLHELSVERSFWEEIFTGKHTSLKFDFFDLSNERACACMEQKLATTVPDSQHWSCACGICHRHE
ncbi:MAG: hypothetical protein ACRC12_00035 [Holosporales bacterium]